MLGGTDDDEDDFEEMQKPEDDNIEGGGGCNNSHKYQHDSHWNIFLNFIPIVEAPEKNAPSTSRCIHTGIRPIVIHTKCRRKCKERC